MDISELIFINLGPFLYNLIFILLWILWFLYHKKDPFIQKAFKTYLKRNYLFYPITGCLIVIFLYLLFSYAIINTDVDDAITSAVRAFLEGSNPYQENVVEHYIDSEMVLGRYHYFPPDLLIYSLFYILIGHVFYEDISLLGRDISLLGTYWFVPLHFLLVIPGYWIITQLVDWPHYRLFPFTLLLITPFLFTNSMLMWFFFLIGYYYYEKKERHILGMVFYVLAASVKYMVGFIILFYFIRTIKEIYKEEDPLNNLNLTGYKLAPYILSSLVLTLICLPFGLINVIDSVFISQGDPQHREDVAQSVGPLLIEVLKFLNLKSLYLPIVGTIAILAFIILMRQPTYDQIIHFSFLSMIILPFYATELFITLPFFFWFKEGAESIKLNINTDIPSELPP
ncbi:MAG: hypothetical protein ACFFB5_00950 [Promethearchaeota archaeon]